MKIWRVQINFKAKICEFFKFILSSVLTKRFYQKRHKILSDKYVMTLN